MIKMTGARIILELLGRQGVRIIAGIPGGANLPLYDALAQTDALRHVLARHEQGAGFIAQGMARATGRPGVCFTTSGPGATNVLTALADAKLDSIPMVCMTGQVPTGMIGTDAFQEVDTFGMSVPLTKHNYLVKSAGELLDVIPESFRIACSGRPGPVLIDVPKDVQTDTVEFGSWPGPGRPDPIPAPDPSYLRRAADLINASRRPVLLLGGGIIHSGGSRAAALLAEKASLPSAMTLMGLGALPSDHPLALGMVGMHGARYTNMVMEECDLLIAVGARFDDRATGKVSRFCPGATVIHIDIDPSEIGKIKTAHLGIAGDAREALDALLPLIEENRRPEWLDRVAALKGAHPLQMNGHGDPRTPYGLIRLASEVLDDRAIISTDVGQHQMWTAQAYPIRRPRQWITSGGLGTMGFGLPAAIGASLAEPDRTVVCFSGDGSLLMNIQELATAVEEGANVKIIVMNNNSLGLVRQQQDLFYGRRIFAADYRRPPDFAGIAAGFGMRSVDLSSGDDPAGLLASAIDGPGPCLINAPIDIGEKVFPMVPQGAANRDMIGGDAGEMSPLRR